jgi:hypothetical protein
MIIKVDNCWKKKNFVRKVIKYGTCYVVYFGCQNKTLSTQINQKQRITISMSIFPPEPTSFVFSK